MHKILKINDIYISFNYQFDDYFTNNLDKYEVSIYPNDIIKMSVIVSSDIALDINYEKKYANKNQIIYESQKEKYIVTYINDFSDIKHIIYFSLDYKNIQITLNKKIDKKLAEYEYVLSGMMFLELALYNNYLPIHASAFTVNNYTVLLSAPSGVGKSTQTNFFKKIYPDITLINEDKPLLKLIDGECYVIGSPWSGKDAINANVIKKVDAIFFLNQANELKIVSLDDKEKIRLIFKNIQRPVYQDLIDQLSLIINNLIKNVNIYQFNNINNSESAKFLIEFMEGINENKK